jgi:hypothetical protein
MITQSRNSPPFMESESSLPCSLFPVLIQMHPDHSLSLSHPVSLKSILMLCSHLRLGFLSGVSPSVFSTKVLYAVLICPIRTTCPTHLILLNLITLTIFGEGHKLWNSPFGRFANNVMKIQLSNWGIKARDFGLWIIFTWLDVKYETKVCVCWPPQEGTAE